MKNRTFSLFAALGLASVLLAATSLAGPLAPEDVWATSETSVTRFI